MTRLRIALLLLFSTLSSHPLGSMEQSARRVGEGSAEASALRPGRGPDEAATPERTDRDPRPRPHLLRHGSLPATPPEVAALPRPVRMPRGPDFAPAAVVLQRLPYFATAPPALAAWIEAGGSDLHHRIPVLPTA